MDDDTLQHYLGSSSAAIKLARGRVGQSYSFNDPKNRWYANKQFWTTMWNGMLTARIFNIPPQMYAHLHHLLDVYTTEVVCGMEFSSMPQEFNEDEIDRYRDMVIDARQKVEFPSDLPFDSIWFGYGPGINLTRAQMVAHGVPSDVRDEFYSLTIVGHLITNNGFVVEAMHGERCVPGPAQGYVFLPTYFDNKWEGCFSLVPWLLHCLINVVNDHKTFVLEKSGRSLAYNRQFSKAAKKVKVKRFPPAPYYTIIIGDKIIEEKTRSLLQSRTTKEYLYRFDVRGDERIRIKRGKLPIDPSLAEELAGRKYKVHVCTQPDEETCVMLARRKIRLRASGEWLAVLRYKVKPHQKGPENALYVPAIRTPKKGVAKALPLEAVVEALKSDKHTG